MLRLFMAPEVQEIADRRAGPSASTADLRRSFEALPAEQRAALVLHLYYGYSVAETAVIVEAPVETVRSRLRLGRERLRTSLGDEP
jgi:RNA polymerase sigma-70 factor (ECF subfamily)